MNRGSITWHVMRSLEWIQPDTSGGFHMMRSLGGISTYLDTSCITIHLCILNWDPRSPSHLEKDHKAHKIFGTSTLLT